MEIAGDSSDKRSSVLDLVGCLAQLGIKSGLAKDFQHLGNMGVASGLHHQFDLNILRGEYGEGALVVHLFYWHPHQPPWP